MNKKRYLCFLKNLKYKPRRCPKALTSIQTHANTTLMHALVDNITLKCPAVMSDRISNTCHICQIKFVSHCNSMTMHPSGKVLSYVLTQSQWITGSSFREVAGVREEKHTYHSDSLRCIHPVWLQSISAPSIRRARPFHPCIPPPPFFSLLF